MGKTAAVVIDKTAFQFDKPYSYSIPDEFADTVKPGCRVIVPFGKGNNRRKGFVLSLAEEDDISSLKPVLSVVDETPIIGDELISVCHFLRERTFCTYFDALNTVMPYGLNVKIEEMLSINKDFHEHLNDDEKRVFDYVLSRPEGAEKEKIIADLLLSDDLPIVSLIKKGAVITDASAKRNVGDLTQKAVHFIENTDEDTLDCLTSKQKIAADFIKNLGDVSVKEVMYYTGVSESVIKALEKKNVVSVYEKEAFRRPYDFSDYPSPEKINLTDEQNNAYAGLISDYRSEKGVTSLLYGVTGSGKTKVYLKLADEVIKNGRGVIIMVPEISLTPQTVSIFGKRYGNRIAVFHSAMSYGQRMDEWKRVKNGEAVIAIGTRSAVFAPFENPGLIVIDEEQEHTYKSEQSPRFNARDVARFRINKSGGLLVLASATPSVETFSAARKGKYTFYELKNRYNNSKLPNVVCVDMRKELASGNSSDISSVLAEEIGNTLAEHKQAIILLNRRGHNTYISCPQCGYVETCPNCSITMTYHSANDRIMCHYCGNSKKAERVCPQCGNEKMRFMGSGTQKAEEELSTAFPNASILRLDADSTSARNSFSDKLNKFASGEYDILIGTQMVAKGLDFPNVTLVGVIGADSSAYSEDYRSFERTFSLLTQVIGRAGRGDFSGKAVIQTVSPDSNIIKLAVKQDYDGFFGDEINMRKLMTYPPYCDIALIMVRSDNENTAKNTINEIYQRILNSVKNEYSSVKLIILGPSPASIPKINNFYRYRLIIKVRNSSEFRAMLRKAVDIKKPKNTSVIVDINPETTV